MKRVYKICLIIFVLVFLIFIASYWLYAFASFQMGRESEYIDELEKQFMEVRVEEQNASAHIVTFEIISGTGIPLKDITWYLHEMDESGQFSVDEYLFIAKQTDAQGFTDEQLMEEGVDHLYWLDGNGDGLVGEGDLLKVKARAPGSYKLMGEIEILCVLTMEPVDF